MTTSSLWDNDREIHAASVESLFAESASYSRSGSQPFLIAACFVGPSLAPDKPTQPNIDTQDTRFDIRAANLPEGFEPATGDAITRHDGTVWSVSGVEPDGDGGLRLSVRRVEEDE